MLGHHVHVVRSDGPLHRVLWDFWVSSDYGRALTIFLDRMLDETRESTRKRTWTAQKVYTRVNTGTRNVSSDVVVRDEPVPPADVIEEALEAVRRDIGYKSWTTVQAERGLRPIRTTRTTKGEGVR